MIQAIKEALIQATESATTKQVDAVTLTRTDVAFGDYSTNIAMQLAKDIGDSPRNIADLIAENLNSGTYTWLKQASVAGPGFINITLTDAALCDLWQLTPSVQHKDEVVTTEYSDPNPFKVLHAGHLYTTLVGNAIANIMQKAGAQVVRLNYGGDVGLHVAKAMYGIIKHLDGEFPEKLQSVPEAERATWVSARYVEGNAAYEDEASKQEIIAINKKVYIVHGENDTTSPFAQIYWTCRSWSYDGFDALYNELAVVPFDAYVPESKVTPLGVALVQKGLESKLFTKSDGAVVYDGEASGLHTRVFINSNGLPTYEAKELGLAEYKWQTYHFNKNIIITGNDIVEYMKVLLSAIGHFYPEVQERTTHLTHGMITFAGGKKMSSRSGNVLLAQDIITAAQHANTAASGKDDDRVAIGAIKYAFLKQRMGADIVYDPEESISLQGNSGPYLQYAHARARSILSKVADRNSINLQATTLTENERVLSRELAHYSSVLDQAIYDITPHILCTYLYELSQVFNRFYEQSRVIGDERQDIRLELTWRYAETLKDGLAVLGIEAPDSM